MPNEIFKYSVDYPLEDGSDILQPKRHDFITEILRPVVKVVLSLSGGYILI